MRVIPTVLGAVFFGIGATSALGAPSLSDPALSPVVWSNTDRAGAVWIQNDFGPALAGPVGRHLVRVVVDGADNSPLTRMYSRSTVPELDR